MGLLSSLFSGVSGLNASGNKISVIGDNIANSGTTGYKASRAEFVDVLSGSLGGAAGQIGQGTRLSGVSQSFAQGSLETTNITTDLAIDGAGFFIVEDANGRYYTRAGGFKLDNQEILVNNLGQSVLGYGISAGVPNGALGVIDLRTASSQPTATSAIEVNVNLDPQDTSLPGGIAGFDLTDTVTTSNFQTGMRVYDSLGNSRNLTVYFRKDDAAANSWFWVAGTNRGELDLSAYGGAFAAMSATPPDQFFPVQSGTLTFTTDGLLSVESDVALSVPYDADGDGVLDGALATPGNGATGWHFNGGATPAQAVTFDFGVSIAEGGTGADRTTQFGGTSASGVNNFVRFTNQDGFAAGSLQSVVVDDDGFVTGQFSNGQTVRLAQVALARFPNANGLNRVGQNNWIETLASGAAIEGSPNQSGLGAIRSGFIELSNADLAEQFVQMILAQRAFQANTRTISTTNELLAQLVVLGQ